MTAPMTPPPAPEHAGLRWVEAETLADQAAEAAAEHARRAPDPERAVDWWTERLLDAAELEAAVGEAFVAGGPAAAAAALRRHTLATARGLAVAHAIEREARAGEQAAERAGGTPPAPNAAANVARPSVERAHAALAASAHVAAVAVRDAVAAGALGARVPVRESAGWADGGLYPETYAEAARQFARRVGPARVLVVGVRGAGTGLAAVVADTLARRGVETRALSVRAGEDVAGVLADHALDAEVRAFAHAPGAWAAVVDEGPAPGGGSFAAVARALAERGFEAAHVVFFTQHDVQGVESPDAAHRQFAATFDAAVLARGGVRCHVHAPDCKLVDVTGADGRTAWREFHCASDHFGDGPVRLTYVGLGRAGRARAEEAERRAAAGEGPRVFGLRRGFLVTAAGTPVGAPSGEGGR